MESPISFKDVSSCQDSPYTDDQLRRFLTSSKEKESLSRKELCERVFNIDWDEVALDCICGLDLIDPDNKTSPEGLIGEECGHFFHSECLTDFWKKKGKVFCPYCGEKTS